VARRRGVPADSKNVSRQDLTSLAEALRLPTLHEQIQEAMEYKDNNEKFLGKEFSTDDEIRDQFNPLFGGIHAWSESFSRHRGAGQTDAQLKDLYDWQVSTLASEKERQLFAHSLVTRFLCNTVFRTYDKDLSVSSVTGKDYWLDENSRAALEALESRLYASTPNAISHTDHNDWRTTTAILLARTRPEIQHDSERELDPSLQSHVELINSIMKPWKKHGREDDLEYIVKDAVELSLLLRRQRPWWSVILPGVPLVPAEDSKFSFDRSVATDIKSVPNFTVMFDPETMEHAIEPTSQDQEVRFIVRPALYRRGTTVGTKFDEVPVRLQKAKVVCGTERE